MKKSAPYFSTKDLNRFGLIFRTVEVFFYFAGGEESLKGKQIRIRSPTNLVCWTKLTL